MSVRYFDATMESTRTELWQLADRDEFRSRLLAEIYSLEPADLLVIDFEGLEYIKLGLLKETFEELSTAEPSAIIFINATPAAITALTKSTGITGHLERISRVWPVLDQSGNVAWLGEPDEDRANALTSILLEQSQTAVEDDGTSQLLRSNAALFSSVGNDASVFSASDNVHEALRLLQTLIGLRFKSQLEQSGIMAEGHFKLPNGSHSQIVFQSSLLLNNPEFIKRIAAEIIRRARRLGIDTIIGSSLLSVAITQVVSQTTGYICGGRDWISEPSSSSDRQTGCGGPCADCRRCADFGTEYQESNPVRHWAQSRCRWSGGNY